MYPGSSHPPSHGPDATPAIRPKKDARPKGKKVQTSSQRERRAVARATKLNAENRRLGAENARRKRAGVEQEKVLQALVITQELELERISRQLHDEIGQQVAALLLGLKQLQGVVTGRADTDAAFRALKSITEQIGHDVHNVAVELRPTSLSDLGLVRSLEGVIGDRGARSAIRVDFDHEEFGAERLPELLETTLYRVLYEALNNVYRHAGAKRASVILRRSAEQVSGIVEDDGVGFNLTRVEARRPRRHLGLMGMRERVALVDGEIAIESAPGRGTTVIVRLPLPAIPGTASHE